MLSPLNTFYSAVCSIFSFDALSYTVPQLPNVDASNLIFSNLLLLIIIIAASSIITLQTRRVFMKRGASKASVVVNNNTTSITISNASTARNNIHMSDIDGDNLNQKGKPPEDSITLLPFEILTTYQKCRRLFYAVNDAKCFSFQDVTIESDFNHRIIRLNSNSSCIKKLKLPLIQIRSPLVFEQCSKIDLIKKAAAVVIKSEDCNKFNFSFINSFLK